MQMKYVKFFVSKNCCLTQTVFLGSWICCTVRGVILNSFILISICLCKRILCSGAVLEL